MDKLMIDLLRSVCGFKRASGMLRLLAVCVLMQACKGDDPAVRGQLMVVLQTDMSLPKDVTQVKVLVKVDGKPMHDKNYIIAPGEDWVTKLPATLAVVADVDNPTPPVEVTVVGLREREARVFAQAITTIPERRTATLFVPIQWLCDGQVDTLTANAGYVSSCSPKNGEERACKAGSCETVKVKEDTLPDFEEGDVFGGASIDSKLGLCFDTQACFETGATVLPNEDCVVELPVPEGFELNLGLLNPIENAGICEEGGDCIVPLDRHEVFGWSYASGTNARSNPVRAKLPAAVCTKLAAGEFQGVSATFGCASKTLQFPTCGPWSVVTKGSKPKPGVPSPPEMLVDGGVDGGEVAPPDADIPMLDSLTIELTDDGPIEIGLPITLELLATEQGATEAVNVAALAVWSSSDDEVATVESGVVTGHSAGNATVTAEFGGLATTFDIEVERGTPESVEIVDPSADPVPAGLTRQLAATATYIGGSLEDVSELATWTSSDESVATVVEGLLTGLTPGEVTLTASFGGTESESITVTIGEPVLVGFGFSTRDVAVNVFQVVLTAKYSAGEDVEVTAEATWEQIDGQEFGTLDPLTGIVTVTDQGPINIEATYDGRTEPLLINVTYEGADAG